MRTRLAVLLILLAPAALRGADDPKLNTLTPKEIADGWISLFDGQSLTGWSAPGGGKWRVKEGTLSPEDRAGPLVSTTAFADLQLTVEYLTENAAWIAVGSRPDRTAEDQEPSIPLTRLGKGWCRATVRVEKGEITSFGIEAVDGSQGASAPVRPPKNVRGHIALGGSKVAFRNVKLRPLGTKELFNGKDLTGWKKHKGEKYASRFEVSNGVLTIKDGPGDLQTEGKWDNFILQLECKTNGKLLNSGVFFRCREGEYQQGYEAQIHNGFDPDKQKEYTVEEFDPKTNEAKEKRKITSPALDYGTGAIYRRVPVVKQLARDNEWFTMTVVADGKHIATWVNGVQAIDWTDNRPLKENARQGCYLNKGHISFQGHDPTTDLSFRNIRLAELPSGK